MLTEQEILEQLAREGAVLTKQHFVYTSGLHGTAYINMRAMAHNAWWMYNVGVAQGDLLESDGVDLIIGPETLGRTLAGYAALATTGQPAIWCLMEGDNDDKRAEFSPKFPQFQKMVEGKRLGIVDDLLTTGSSIRAVASLVYRFGGQPVAAAAAVRRTPNIEAGDCGVENLHVLADIPGFETFTEDECGAVGPCSRKDPIVLRPGHGHAWIKSHPDYPVAA